MGGVYTLLLDLNDLEILPDGDKANERSDESEDDGPEGVVCHSLGGRQKGSKLGDVVASST